VVYVKIIQSSITIDHNIILSEGAINDNDPIYIMMNDYKRISSFIRDTPTSEGNLFKFFDMINIDLTKTYHLTKNFNITNLPTLLTYKNEYPNHTFDANDTSVYLLNPIEPNLKMI